MAKLIVGIDFGTSTTVVRWRREDSDIVHTITDSNGMDPVINSAIFIPKVGENWIFGKQALNKARKSQGTLVRNFKMDLINPKKEKQAKKYVQKFMEHIYQLFVKQTAGVKYDSMDVYVSYPVKWSIEKKTLMKQFVSDAGFGVNGQIIGKTEPVATATELLRFHVPHLMSGGVMKTGKPLNVLMLDMGAGTSDLLLFQLAISSNGEINIPEDKMQQYPNNIQPLNCGGREIDSMLSQDVLNYLGKAIESDCIQEEWFDSMQAKLWKDSIVSAGLKGNKPSLCIDDIPSIAPIINRFKAEGKWNNTVGEYRMSQNKFEAITENHWSNLYKLIENGMAKFKQQSGITPGDIDLILLTGGHSQWYCVRKLFDGKGINGTIAVDSPQYNSLRFAKIIDESWRILQGDNPQETVANGLCWPNWAHIPNKAENNVWIRLNVNGVCTGYKKIITAGSLLPQTQYIGKKQDNIQSQCECSEDEYSVKINRHMVFDSTSDILAIELLEGDTIENSTRSRFLYQIKDLGVKGKFFLALLFAGLPFLFREDKVFGYNAHIGINQDGTISINGYFEIDGKKDMEFTEKDFSVL